MDKTESSGGASTMLMAMVVLSNIIGAFGVWDSGHATFYGDGHGGGTFQGACGYGNLNKQGYGLATTALSGALFNNGQTCGACFQVMCVDDPKWCLPGTITVTATNLCPASSHPSGNWCNPPQKHFDLTQPMFLTIAKLQAGIVPSRFQRVTCFKRGGIKFELKGNQNFLLVLVYNVGGAGDVVDVKIKGSRTGWIQMRRNWGQNWQTGGGLQGQSLSFQVTTSDKRTVQSIDVAPANWQIGQTYEGSNF